MERPRPPARRPARREMAPVELDGPATRRHPTVPAVPGTPVRHIPTGVAGVVERFENADLLVRAPDGRVHRLPLLPGRFEIGGRLCLPVVGRSTPEQQMAVSASGSRTPRRAAPAKVARAARILVEGVHDAELVEKIWGDDLRDEGVVVERLDGMDVLPRVVAGFRPGPGRRLGILLDHLVPGSKEARAAAAVSGAHVLVTGTPYVDVWQAVKPAVAGVGSAWPAVPLGEDWKTGVLARIGRPGEHPGAFWRELLGRVRTYADLTPPLVGAVEQLIDFVTEPGEA